MKKKHGIAVCLFWLLLWQLAALMIDNSILIAGPVQVLKALWTGMTEYGFLRIVFTSYGRIMAGFLTAFAAGLLLGILAWKIQWIKEFLAPVMGTVKAVPVASFVVLLLIWFGSRQLSFWCCFLVVLPNVYENTAAGLQSTDRKLLEMAEVYHIPWWKKAFYIYRPAVMPFLLGSSRISVGMSFKSGVAAELIGVPSFSIGERLYMSKVHLDTAGVLAWTAVVILLSILSEKCVVWLLSLYARRKELLAFRYQKDMRNPVKENNGKTIRLHGLKKSYQSELVLSDLNFSIEKGKIYCLMGASGSGKTTLLRLLMGLEEADEKGCLTGLENERISAVFQENRLCEETDACNNIWLAAGSWGKKSIGESLREILPEDVMSKTVKECSGGMKRRIAVIRAMLSESNIILMDEPFTGLDGENKKKVIEYVLRKRKGRTLIVATHQEEDALMLGGRVIRLRDNRTWRQELH